MLLRRFSQEDGGGLHSRHRTRGTLVALQLQSKIHRVEPSQIVEQPQSQRVSPDYAVALQFLLLR